MSAFLTGKNVYLRAISQSDATSNYLSWLNDPEVTHGLASGTFPTNMESLNSFLSGVVENRDIVMFAICDMSTHLHIGNIKLDRFDWISRTCELGLLIGDRTYWGKGIGSEVMNLVTRFAFEDLDIRKISLTVYSNNPAAIRLYEKVGFETEGVLKNHIYSKNSYIDKIWMSIFRKQ
jgi:RimJ/RimL family protein N-acetyltransferase